MHHIFRMSKFNTRPKNLLIIADAGAGKTALSNAFTQSIIEEGAGNSQKLVLFQMPPVPSEKAIMFALLDKMGVDFVSNHTLENLKAVFCNVARDTGLSLILFDEFNNLLAAPKNKILGSMNLLKWIGNELHIPIIALGTKASNRLLTYDKQFTQRYRVSGIGTWEDGDDFRSFVHTYLEQLPGTELRTLTNSVFKILLASTSRTTNDIITVLSHSAFEQYTDRQEESFPIIVKEVAAREGYLG